MNDSFIEGISPIDATDADLTNNGLHAVLAVGFDDDRDLLTVRNSWGSDWGRGGYADITYSFVDRRATSILLLQL